MRGFIRRHSSAVAGLAGFLVVLSILRGSAGQNGMRPRNHAALEKLPVFVRSFDLPGTSIMRTFTGTSNVVYDGSSDEDMSSRDFGGITLHKVPADKFYRDIYSNDEGLYEMRRRKFLQKVDASSSEDEEYKPDDQLEPSNCRRTRWHSFYFPTCNNFHEIDLGRPPDHEVVSNYDIRFLGKGYFRASFQVSNRYLDSNSTFVLKATKMSHTFGIHQQQKTKQDALVMERLTSSPRIVNIYGACSTSVAVEPALYDVYDSILPRDYIDPEKDLHDEFDVDPQNNFTAEEKLDIALTMAESLADMHGFEGGMIVHNDVQLSQWLRMPDGGIKLGDFNRAFTLYWEDRYDSYCKFYDGYGAGCFRSAEEYRGKDRDDKVDVYSLGNIFYSVLTGLSVYYEDSDHNDCEIAKDKVKHGVHAYIDARYRTRSFIEGELVKIMEKCWALDSAKRVDIFEVVSMLRKTKEKHEHMMKDRERH